MKNRWLLYYIILIITSITTNISTTFAYFNITKVESAPIVVELGSWTWIIKEGITIDDAPIGTFDLDEFIESGSMDIILPFNSYFMYEYNLYRVTSTTGYNPQWHGLPGSSSAGWAFISLMLEWLGAQQRYDVGAVVRIDGRYFQAMHLGNTNDPLTNHGPTKPINSGKPWREIEPMEDYMFLFLENTNLRDYSNPNPIYVVEKY